MNVVVQLGPRDGDAPTVEYRWDPDTEILSAHLRSAPGANGSSGSVEIEGADGSWIILDVRDERISGLEVAVWPEVSKRSALAPPPQIREASVRLPAAPASPAITAVEMETPMFAEADQQERNFHFRFGLPRESSVVRVGRDLLLEVDATNHVAGLWLLNVPPFPDEP